MLPDKLLDWGLPSSHDNRDINWKKALKYQWKFEIAPIETWKGDQLGINTRIDN